MFGDHIEKVYVCVFFLKNFSVILIVIIWLEIAKQFVNFN